MNSTREQIRQDLKQKTKNLLEKPGIYIMYDENYQKLYIGKSINLRQRVASYWNKSGERSNKIRRMIRLVVDFQVYYTDTELDALLLECRWIEQFKPPYNTALTRLDREIYFDIYKAHPYAFKVSKAKHTRADYRFGPFANKRLAMKAYSYIRQNYPYFFCSYYTKKLDPAHCRQIMDSRCQGVCHTAEEGLEQELIQTVFNEGDKLKQQLEEKMYALAERLEFEQAGELLQQIRGLDYIYRINQWLQEVRQLSYIGCLAVVGEQTYKYYLIDGGEIISQMCGYKVHEHKIFETLEKVYKDSKCNDNTTQSNSVKNNKVNKSTFENSYFKTSPTSSAQCLIINQFRKHKMQVRYV